MRIRLIQSAETHALRQQVLRPTQPLNEMEWPGDDDPASFHLGLDDGEALVAIASFLAEQNALVPGGTPFRLRGMAVHPGHQGQGLGRKLLHRGMGHLHAKAADVLWCNARNKAKDFYTKAGFTVCGAPFSIAGIGVHHLMYRRL